MAPTTKIRKFATAKRLGIEGYRTMTDEQLDAAIAKASSPAPSKGKTATVVAKGKGKGKVSTSPAKGKTAATTATAVKGKTATAPAAKSTARKSSPRATAVKGKATRQSGSPVKGKTSTTRKPATTRTTRTTRKPAVTKTPVKRAPKAAVNANGKRGATIVKTKGTREFLDKSSIDWKAASAVGTTGKRKEVLDALRKYKGDYDKTFELLSPNWRRYYPKHTKVAALKLLRWLIARVAYDFAMSIQAHDPGSRRAYGTAGTNGSAPRTTATKAVSRAKATTSARKPAAAKAKTTRARTTSPGRKPAQSRTAAPKGKRGAKVTSGRR
jgi:hypothetical protein